MSWSRRFESFELSHYQLVIALSHFLLLKSASADVQVRMAISCAGSSSALYRQSVCIAMTRPCASL